MLHYERLELQCPFDTVKHSQNILGTRLDESQNRYLLPWPAQPSIVRSGCVEPVDAENIATLVRELHMPRLTWVEARVNRCEQDLVGGSFVRD